MIYSYLALAYFVAATAFLMALSAFLLGFAVWGAITGIFSEHPVDALLDSIGVIIIGFAVVETAKFIAEEEVIRKRELRSSRESRRSITKFITIIVIAASLEALVMVFQTSRIGIEYAIYPAMLFTAAMFALIALGVYQWLSRHVEQLPPEPEDLSKVDESAPEKKDDSD